MTKAIGVGLALFSFSCPGFAVESGIENSINLQTAFDSGISSVEISYPNSTIERWRSYALVGIMPGFGWAAQTATPGPQPPALLDKIHAIDLAPWHEDPLHVQINLTASSVGELPAFSASGVRGSLLGQNNIGLDRYVLTPGVLKQWGEEGTWSASAILAYQRFASLGMGSVNWKDGYLPVGALRDQDGSFGTGMRFDISNMIGDSARWSLGFQSRVNMDTFNTYRGVFSEPGDFDIPASADVGLKLAIAPQVALDFGVQHVMYNAITPFTSNSLPTRFLALLGDATSPVFAWRDLTIYSVGWTWHDTTTGDWQLRYSTREQPSPTSDLLEQALRNQLSSHSVAISFARNLAPNSNLRVAASYAPNEYVLGAPTSYSVHDNYTGNQLEVEALWSYQF